MSRGRKPKVNTSGPDSRSHRRESSTAAAFSGRRSQAETVAKTARAKPPALATLIKRLVQVATSSDAAARRYASSLARVRKQGVSLDDVAALVLGRLAIVEDALEHDGISMEKALTELGRINRELAELAAAYREQGRSLPDAITFRLDLTRSTVPAGEQPDDAPPMATDATTGDVIETE